jgi:hypothetical protein
MFADFSSRLEENLPLEFKSALYEDRMRLTADRRAVMTGPEKPEIEPLTQAEAEV